MSALQDIIGLLFPRTCAVCGKRLQIETDGVMCVRCASQLPLYPLEDTADNALLRLAWSAAPFEHGATLFYYRHHSPFHHLVTDIKYHGRSDMARLLGRYAAQRLREKLLATGVEAFVPVPLSKERQRERGYNQAEQIARGMGEILACPVLHILKGEDGIRQQKLGGEARRENVKDRYEARLPEEWKGRHLMVVDDVFTTGSTVSACGKALLECDKTLHLSFFCLTFAG